MFFSFHMDFSDSEVALPECHIVKRKDMKLFCFFLDVFIAVFRSAAVVGPQTQRGKQHFTEGPEIDHAPSKIQPLKGLQRMPTPTAFAFITVLQIPGPATAGPA